MGVTDIRFFAKVVGRRKTAVANLELMPGNGKIQINEQLAKQFFFGYRKRLFVTQKPFFISTSLNFNAKVKVIGGGIQSQAKSIQLALTRALVLVEPKTRVLFRKYGLLTRDCRRKERRKYGLKKARKAPQFSKRLLNSLLYHFLLNMNKNM
jgi:small subunit ribosomal protein S9